MDKLLQTHFINQWEKYFPKAELPIVVYYTDNIGNNTTIQAGKGFKCVICEFQKARRGIDLYFGESSLACTGAKHYCGFTDRDSPNLEYFLSYGIPGEMEGERYLKTPELAKKAMEQFPAFIAPQKYMVVKRWDKLGKEDPLIVIFYASGDTLSGLFTLANFDDSDTNSVICPFSSGCSSIIQLPFNELKKTNPKAILGMFDVSARPCVKKDELSFAIPFSKFERMVHNMDESFLITDSWKKVKKR